MLWGKEYPVLTPWYKKDCCSFVLFINGMVNMSKMEERVELECLILNFVKCWFRLYGCGIWYKIYIILPTS